MSSSSNSLRFSVSFAIPMIPIDQNLHLNSARLKFNSASDKFSIIENFIENLNHFNFILTFCDQCKYNVIKVSIREKNLVFRHCDDSI
ncbi:hypothetical protein BpHYR1_010508 [Brachionus plicatilis]|uniref:Uncharacterized protein n=1 Tax=Brachionus plicatilis TaxID=10195 RepID=A0A3M7SI63_BRAPC|nr:hypothetical protein BpHYR1_010508 [Brachionus plicatilis]